ncbi:unnamed protein product, partial [Scytosiphon promiscuus]
MFRICRRYCRVGRCCGCLRNGALPRRFWAHPPVPPVLHPSRQFEYLLRAARPTTVHREVDDTRITNTKYTTAVFSIYRRCSPTHTVLYARIETWSGARCSRRA